jgi:hypothetical protein
LGYSQDEAKRFTGHWVRRTSLTWAANAGQTTLQMMELSGHVSATVVQRYVNDNDTMRLSNAAAVSIGGGSHSRPRSPSPEDDSTSSVRHSRPRSPSLEDDPTPSVRRRSEVVVPAVVAAGTNVYYTFNFTGATINAPFQVGNTGPAHYAAPTTTDSFPTATTIAVSELLVVARTEEEDELLLTPFSSNLDF